MMRHLLVCLACFPAMSIAQQPPEDFNQEQFEIRFRAADRDGDGRLSREEAYAAFPRATELFVEIDANRDDHITLAEVYQARAKRIEAALNAASIGGDKYVNPKYIKDSRVLAGGQTGARDLASSLAQKRNNEFNEFMDGNQEPDPYPDPPVVADSASNLVKKPF
ncbi:MAG: hypothetical protein FIA96_05075 [Betaproteobacteria bacterium]|nr:hypothetical protein [Betaproteobacteria bacterium]